MEVCSLSVVAADEFFTGLKLTEFQQKIAGEIIREIRACAWASLKMWVWVISR